MENSSCKDSASPWLAGLTREAIEHDPLPLVALLENSLYYPASGFDGDPVAYLAGEFSSFVYVDCGYSQEQLQRELAANGFIGYQVMASREVTPSELSLNGWQSVRPGMQAVDKLSCVYNVQSPFCKWIIFERLPGYNDDHGPQRYSLLYLCADGVAAYDALYVSNHLTAKAIAVIQPGTGWGGNWTDFTDPAKILARTVLGNPAGKPEVLLYGGSGGRQFYSKTCWPEFTLFKGFLGNTSIGVWER